MIEFENTLEQEDSAATEPKRKQAKRVLKNIRSHSMSDFEWELLRLSTPSCDQPAWYISFENNGVYSCYGKVDSEILEEFQCIGWVEKK